MPSHILCRHTDVHQYGFSCAFGDHRIERNAYHSTNICEAEIFFLNLNFVLGENFQKLLTFPSAWMRICLTRSFFSLYGMLQMEQASVFGPKSNLHFTKVI